MHIRLKDMLVALAEANNIAIGDGWPLLNKYLRWLFVSGCGIWRDDTACTIFTLNEGDGSCLSHYHGWNITVLIERTATIVWDLSPRERTLYECMAFILDRVDATAKNPACHEMLNEAYTTAPSAARFALEAELRFPEHLHPSRGRTAGVHYESWCHQKLDYLVRSGLHKPRRSGVRAAAHEVHLLLGGKVTIATAEKAIRKMYAQYVEQASRAK